MVRVAEVTAEAGSIVEKRKIAEEKNYYYGSYFSVYDVAKDMAVERATIALEAGDREGVKANIETMLAISLISAEDHGDRGCESQVRVLVADGMAVDLYEAARDMHGLIAVRNTSGRSMQAVSVPEVLQSTADLIRVASNTDFDDQMQHPAQLVRDGLPREDITRQEKMIDGMECSHVAALSHLAGRKLKNPDWAASLAVRAGEKLVEESEIRSADDVVATTETLSALSQYGLGAADRGRRQQAQAQFDTLRQMRSAGLKPYRSNNQITAVLDRAMVRLALEGDEKAVRLLISSSPHDVPPLDTSQVDVESQLTVDVSQPEREFLDANLGWAIYTELEHSTPNERLRAHQVFLEAQAERSIQLHERLLEAGATPSSVDAIIANSSDPDSAMGISPEFWDVYNKVTQQGAYSEQGGYGKSPGDVRDIIEGQQSFDLTERSTILSELLSAGANPYDISHQIVQYARGLEEPAAKSDYIKQLTAVMTYARSEAAETEIDGIFVRRTTFIENASRFTRPEDAIAIARRLFGPKALSQLYKLSKPFESYASRGPTMPNEAFLGMTDKLLASFGDQQIQDILSSDSLPLDRLVQLGTDEVTAMIDGIKNSEILADAVHLGHGAELFRYVVTAYGEDEPLTLLESVYGDPESGLRSIIQGLAGHEAVQSALLSEVLRGQLGDMSARSQPLRDYFEHTQLRDALIAHPGHSEQILSLIRTANHDIETIPGLSEALLDSSLQTLVYDFVDSEQATVIIGRICESLDANQVLHDMLRVYEETSFLQERGIAVDFASHVEQWTAFLDAIPGGHDGVAFRNLAIKRLTLGIGEDPTQAIRVFTELAPNQEMVTQMRLEGFKLIYSLLHAETTRGYPSIKPGKLAEVFFDSEVANLYRQAFLLKQAGNKDQLEALIGGLNPEGNQGGDMALPLAEHIAVIKAQILDLRAQDNSATKWLRQYAGQDIKSAKLIEAWKARQFALDRGVKDNPRDILYFVATEGLLLYASEMIGEGATDVTLEEIEGYKDFATHLGGRYGQQRMFSAVERLIHFRREHGFFPEKLIPAYSSSVTEAGKQFTAEVFRSDDPRGMTIGYDTGCCMTLGGASESCIWAGYEDGRYSFMGVYDEQGKLRAQSILYVAEQDGKKVLVIDNIETNEGTDLTTVASVYKRALVEMMRETETPFDSIHIGVGYTPKAILASLPVTKSYPTPKFGVYSDAGSQRLLWSSGAGRDA
jgi:hypothetical protein